MPRTLEKLLKVAPGLVTALALFTACQDAGTRQPRPDNSAQPKAAAPPATESADRKVALVRIVNADPTNLSAAFRFNGQLLKSDVPFKSVTEYVPVAEGSGRLSAMTMDPETELASTMEIFASGNRYTVLRMMNSSAKVELRTLRDHPTAPDSGKALIRFVVATPWLGEFTIASHNKRAFETVEPQAATDYIEAKPYAGPLRLHGKSKGRYLGRIDEVNFEAGKRYTVVIFGGMDGMPVDRIVITDKLY
jgi:hypothetical protein